MPLSRAAQMFRTVKEGVSARAGLARARADGLKIRDATWFRGIGEIRNHYGQTLSELDRPLNRRPTPTEIAPLSSKKARGYIQYVDLVVTNRTTGTVSMRPQAVHTSRLMSREAVIEVAVNRYRGAVDRSKVSPATWGTDPDEVVEGGIYTATQQFRPGP